MEQEGPGARGCRFLQAVESIYLLHFGTAVLRQGLLPAARVPAREAAFSPPANSSAWQAEAFPLGDPCVPSMMVFLLFLGGSGGSLSSERQGSHRILLCRARGTFLPLSGVMRKTESESLGLPGDSADPAWREIRPDRGHTEKEACEGAGLNDRVRGLR